MSTRKDLAIYECCEVVKHRLLKTLVGKESRNPECALRMGFGVFWSGEKPLG